MARKERMRQASRHASASLEACLGKPRGHINGKKRKDEAGLEAGLEACLGKPRGYINGKKRKDEAGPRGMPRQASRLYKWQEKTG